MLSEAQKPRVLARLERLIPKVEYDYGLMEQLADDAAEFVESYTHRTWIPDALLRTVGDLAIVAFNRLGTEGDAARSEAGESYTFETAPAHIYSVLNKYRLARSGGNAHEAKQSEENQS